jgi:BirA family biotin operon repressor/biotin-[acetyl-CoA-carboxylase] ligase
MQLPVSSSLCSSLLYLESAESTNSFLMAEASDTSTWPDFSVVVTDNQTAGRGRSGREWLSAPGAGLAVSILLRPQRFGLERFSWLPLLAGAAMTQAVRTLLPAADVLAKWPNDVLVNGEKISGILSELLPDGSGVVVGAGLNLLQTKDQLPIDAATSLALHGVTGFLFDDVLVRYLAAFKNLYQDFEEASGDPESSGLRALATELSGTIGSQVRAILPGDLELTGDAVALDDSGRLLIAKREDASLTALAAGDIIHLRQ